MNILFLRLRPDAIERRRFIAAPEPTTCSQERAGANWSRDKRRAQRSGFFEDQTGGRTSFELHIECKPPPGDAAKVLMASLTRGQFKEAKTRAGFSHGVTDMRDGRVVHQDAFQAVGALSQRE